LLPLATELISVDTISKELLTKDKIESIISMLPEEWLMGNPEEITPEERRKVYADFLHTRIAHSDIFLNEAEHARKSLI